MIKFKQKINGNSVFDVDINSKKTTLQILKSYFKYHNGEEFEVKDFVSFCRTYFTGYFPYDLTLGGFHRRMNRMKYNNLLGTRKESNGRVHYYLTSYGKDKINNIEELKGGI